MFFQLWYLVENESWADIHLLMLFQRWQKNVGTALIELRWFDVGEPTLFQRWNLVENESWAGVCLSTVFQRWKNNVETTLKELHRFSVDDPKLLQCWYLVEKESWVNICSSALRKQHWNTFVNICCTDVHYKMAQLQNKAKFISINHIFLLYKNIIKLLIQL